MHCVINHLVGFNLCEFINPLETSLQLAFINENRHVFRFTKCFLAVTINIQLRTQFSVLNHLNINLFEIFKMNLIQSVLILHQSRLPAHFQQWRKRSAFSFIFGSLFSNLTGLKREKSSRYLLIFSRICVFLSGR